MFKDFLVPKADGPNFAAPAPAGIGEWIVEGVDAGDARALLERYQPWRVATVCRRA